MKYGNRNLILRKGMIINYIYIVVTGKITVHDDSLEIINEY